MGLPLEKRTYKGARPTARMKAASFHALLASRPYEGADRQGLEDCHCLCLSHLKGRSVTHLETCHALPDKTGVATANQRQQRPLRYFELPACHSIGPRSCVKPASRTHGYFPTFRARSQKHDHLQISYFCQSRSLRRFFKNIFGSSPSDG
jgi:hypothetical protein